MHQCGQRADLVWNRSDQAIVVQKSAPHTSQTRDRRLKITIQRHEPRQKTQLARDSAGQLIVEQAPDGEKIRDSQSKKSRSQVLKHCQLRNVAHNLAAQRVVIRQPARIREEKKKSHYFALGDIQIL